MKLPPPRQPPQAGAAAALRAHPQPQPAASGPVQPFASTTGSGPLFRAPRQSRSAAHLLASARLQRQRSPRGAPGMPGEGFAPEDDNAPSRLPKVMHAMAMDSSRGDGGDDQGRQRQEGQHERRFAHIARMRLPGLDAVDDRTMAQLLSEVRAAASLHDVATAIGPALASGHSSQAGTLLRVARTWQDSRHAGPPHETTSLAQVKQALIHAAGPVAASAPVGAEDRRAIVNIWLPVYLLNLNRPRSPQQRQQASERLALLERGLAAFAARKA